MPNHFFVNRIIRKAAQKPLAIAHRCRGEMKRLEAGYHHRLYDLVLRDAYASAWYFRKSPRDWKRFLAKPFWKKAKKPKSDKGVREELHRVMLYVCDAVSDQAYDRACKYARALEPYLVERVPPAKVRERIASDGGLEKLYDRAKKEIPLRKGKSKKLEEQEWNDDDAELGTRPETRDNEEGAEGQTGGKKASARQPKRASRVRLTLNIEVSPERLERAFGMAKGQEGIMTFKALGVEDDWHRFRATKVKVPAN